MTRTASVTALALALSLGLAGCQKQGPAERVGEELDEAGRALMNGGEQTPADKLDDAVDNVRDAAKDTAERVTD